MIAEEQWLHEPHYSFYDNINTRLGQLRRSLECQVKRHRRNYLKGSASEQLVRKDQCVKNFVVKKVLSRRLPFLLSFSVSVKPTAVNFIPRM